jgi:hypothetical protein
MTNTYLYPGAAITVGDSVDFSTRSSTDLSEARIYPGALLWTIPAEIRGASATTTSKSFTNPKTQGEQVPRKTAREFSLGFKITRSMWDDEQSSVMRRTARQWRKAATRYFTENARWSLYPGRVIGVDNWKGIYGTSGEEKVKPKTCWDRLDGKD